MPPRGRQVGVGRLVGGGPANAAGRSMPRMPGVPADVAHMYSPPPAQSGVQLAARKVPRAIVTFPLEVVPPDGAVQFNPFGQTTTVGAGQVTTLWSFTVPAASLLIVKALDLYAANTTGTSQLAFGLFQNGVPYGGFGSIPLFPGAAAVNSRSFNEQTWRFTENTLIEMRCTNTDGASYVVAGSAQGWYYSTTVADQFKLTVGS